MARNIWSIVLVFLFIMIAIFLIELKPGSILMQKLAMLQLAINEESWLRAEQYWQDIANSWRKREVFIAIENSLEEMGAISISLQRLKFMIDHQDKQNALLEAEMLSYRWSKLAE